MAITIFHNCISNDFCFQNAEIELIIYFQPALWWLQSWLLLLTRHSTHIALAKLVLPIQFEAQLYHNIIWYDIPWLSPIAWYTLTYHGILYHAMPCQIILLIQTKVQRTHPCCGDSGGAIFTPLLMSVYITFPNLTTLYHSSHYNHTFVKSYTIPFKVLDDNGISFH